MANVTWSNLERRGHNVLSVPRVGSLEALTSLIEYNNTLVLELLVKDHAPPEFEELPLDRLAADETSGMCSPICRNVR